ncbi:uncharacterized protein LAESUDRAFT_808735 [Laetiporus sulphureus 93-53]|uniref:NAD(P)-binding protein n=1 Tax=Laetiporus sulphureus 93-53 TaxID=1314785 RepID=A0A165HHK3_9APHY|nr:uncharacterized protein LAESUDRAFT_808735 [Laetiporus sulphureus 93-53]KZT11742.1 hypothetical protein LAESUDRAFT_808735 [Laetiporus sulphureus 93-53]
MLGHINFNSWKAGTSRQNVSVRFLYFQSKLANAIVARQIAKRYADRGIISISVDPGNTKSDLQRYARQRTGVEGLLISIVLKLLLHPTPFGALTQLWAGTMPEAINANGEFAVPTAQVVKCRSEVYDDELGRKVWERLEEEVKGH